MEQASWNTDTFIRSVQLRTDQPYPKVHPFDLPVVRGLKNLDLNPKVTFFVGENGSGKSTLLEAIAVAFGFNPEGGSTNFTFSTRASHSVLHEFLVLAKSGNRPKDGFFLRSESFFNLATEIEALDEGDGGAKVIDAYGGTSLHAQSHGESFLALLMNRFRGNGLYILDEPEAALSPARQLAALRRMHDLIGKGSQFIVATHSPILMAYPGATIYQFGSEGIRSVAYEETEHFVITRQFLNNPEGMLFELLRG